MRTVVIMLGVALAATPAAADPLVERVLTAPTAWLPAAGDTVATAGIDHRGDGMIVVGYGLGGLSEIQIDADSDVRACTDCTGRPDPVLLGRASFRLGAMKPAGLPAAIALGVRTTFDARGRDARVTDGYLVASGDFTYVRVHAGVDLIAARIGDLELAAKARPLAGLEIRPPQYPRTTLMGDIAWEPELDATAGPKLRWIAGWGVRYQALDWASIELAVRHRETEDLGGSTVMVRVNAVWDSKN
jgi:hypothetical protein